jgi:hypothetical protein
MITVECQESMERQSHRCALRRELRHRFTCASWKTTIVRAGYYYASYTQPRRRRRRQPQSSPIAAAASQHQLCNNVVFTLLHLNHSLQQHISILIMVHVYSHGNSKGAQALAVQEQFHCEWVTSI